MSRLPIIAVLTAVLGAGLVVPANATVRPVSVDGTAAVGAGGRAGGTVWLCRPGRSNDPCAGRLTTTWQSTSGTNRVATPRRSAHRPVDCFYLYPTVSEQPTMVANRDIDPELTTIARHQAARFSSVCKVYAPVYRQITLAGLGGNATLADREIAYESARAGWRSYLRRHNDGRGVVLIGHSQGSGILRRLIAEEIEPRRQLRNRIVSAVLAGSAVAVRKGTVTGGDFRRVPGCTRPRQTGCVISYATFGETPPDTTFFGVLRNRPGTTQPWGPNFEALCTNPAALRGGSGTLVPLYPSSPLYGVLGTAADLLFAGNRPQARTPWVSPAARYRGRCVTRNGAHVLLATPIGAAPGLRASPTPEWGLHLVDINLALGNLVPVVRGQIRAYDRN